MSSARIEVYESSLGCWRWKLISRNGRILAHSEAYASNQMCLKTATSVYDGDIVRMTQNPFCGDETIIRDRVLEEDDEAGEHV